MAGEKVVNAQAGKKPVAPESQKRERSTIEFPYGDLDDAVSVATAIHTNAGLSASTDQLAAYMKQSATSGAFRTKTATAGVFGLTTNERGTVSLTSLGRKIVDPAQARLAGAEAFLAVPLYKAVFDKFRGHTLPPPAALEREMANLGVATKQTDKARQAFERSAQQAGFFAHGTDRLVMPAGAPEKSGQAKSEDGRPADLKGGGGGRGDGGGTTHPFIQGLLQKLPPAESQWDDAERVKWLDAAVRIFDLMYQGGAGNVSVELKK
jgi:hypothetical protein